MTGVVRNQQHRNGNVSPDSAQVSGLSHGVLIQGRLPGAFQHYLWPSEGKEAPFVLDVACQTVLALPETEEFWVGVQTGPHPESRFSLFRDPDGFGLKVACLGCGLFRISSSRIRIEWLPGGTGPAHYFFSYALPLWLELNGVPVLHASAVSYGDRAAAFVGQSGAGKSTMCNALVRLGFSFIADDGLALSEHGRDGWRCSPGPPLYRLWPTALAQEPSIVVESLQRVHEGIEKRLLPLSRRPAAEIYHVPKLSTVYVLERQASMANSAKVVPYNGSDALIRLVEFSPVHAPAAALGWTAARVKRLAGLAEKTSVKRLIYASGKGHWQRIRDTITEDLERTGDTV